MNTDRIYVADMWQNQASYKAKGWKAYYIDRGELRYLPINRCRNQWGKIFLLTDAEFEKARDVADKVKEMLTILEKQKELYSELLESTIVHNIIPQ